MNMKEWKVFDWDYEKKFYDVRLKDWTIIKNCWANAWYMIRLDWEEWRYQIWMCEIRESKETI